MTTNHEKRRADNRDDGGALGIALGTAFGAGLGTVFDAAFGTYGMGIGMGAAVGIALGSLFISTSKIESSAKCYKRSFLVFTPVGGILLLLGILSLGARSEFLRALAMGLFFGAIVFAAVGLAHGMKYRSLSR